MGHNCSCEQVLPYVVVSRLCCLLEHRGHRMEVLTPILMRELSPGMTELPSTRTVHYQSLNASPRESVHLQHKASAYAKSYFPTHTHSHAQHRSALPAQWNPVLCKAAGVMNRWLHSWFKPHGEKKFWLMGSGWESLDNAKIFVPSFPLTDTTRSSII